MKAEAPLRDANATPSCPICGAPVQGPGRRYCSERHRKQAWRRRHAAAPPAVVLPPSRSRRPITVYECPTCGARALGEQRCAECATFMRRIGIGGLCPSCDEPVAVGDLIAAAADLPIS